MKVVYLNSIGTISICPPYSQQSFISLSGYGFPYGENRLTRKREYELADHSLTFGGHTILGLYNVVDGRFIINKGPTNETLPSLKGDNPWA